MEQEKSKIPPLRIGNIHVKIPVIQGGMGVGVSLWRLASAVAKEGGIGVIAAVLCGLNEKGFFKDPTGTSVRALGEYVRRSKRESKGAVGVNVMVASADYARYVRAAVDAEADLIISGAGLPLDLPDLVPEDTGVALVPIVSSGRATELILKRWESRYGRYADAVVLEGPKAGGHLGFKKEQIFDTRFSLENLIVDVARVLDIFGERAGREIPLIAAGGVYTGGDIFNILQRGVRGVQMGTRFVTTFECDADQAFKQAYIDAGDDDVVIIESPVGLPGRALRNAFLDGVSEHERAPKKCITKCLRGCAFPDIPYCISTALIHAQRGFLDHGFAFCGSNAPRAKEIVSVADLMRDLAEEYHAAASSVSGT